MTTTDTETDVFTRKRAVAKHAQAVADYAYAVAGAVQQMREQGLSIEDMLAEVWDKLQPREAGILTEGMLVDILSPLLSFLVPLLEGVGGREALSQLIHRLRDSEIGVEPMFASAMAKVESAMDRVGNSPGARMRDTIKRMFLEAPSPLPDQAPAIECSILLTGVPIALTGSLSETPMGGLRLLSPDPDSHGHGKARDTYPMIEQFFSYDDVVVVAVRRVVTVEAPRVVRSS